MVGTLMTNMAVELALKARGVEFVRAKVGDRYVLEELEKRGWLLGGEGSGHLLALDKHTTGDGLISALQVLKASVRSGRSLAQLLEGVSLFPQTLINVRLQPGQDWKKNQALAQETRRAEAELDGQGRVLIRASGTEPVLRVMVEARDEAGQGHGAAPGRSGKGRLSAPGRSIAVEHRGTVPADQPAVVAGDDDRGRTRPRVRATCAVTRIAGPVAQVLGRVGDVRLADGFAGVLDVHEDRPAVRSFRDARDLAVLRTDEEAAQCVRRGLGAHARLHGHRAAVALGVRQRRRAAVAYRTRACRSASCSW